MRNIFTYQKVLYAFVFLLSTAVTVAHPVHILTEHSGFFYHHGDQSGHTHSDEEEICGICINLTIADLSDSEERFATLYSSFVEEKTGNLFGKKNYGLIAARAPPNIQIEELLILSI